MRWTDAQRRAIEERGNLIVSAAAGAGKAGGAGVFRHETDGIDMVGPTLIGP